MDQEQINELKKIRDELREDSDDYIERRIKHTGFAKIIFHIGIEALDKKEFINAKDISNYRQVTQQRALMILDGLAVAGILKKIKKEKSNLVYFYIKTDDHGNPIINKYFKIACNTLGIKQKLVMENKELIHG